MKYEDYYLANEQTNINNEISLQHEVDRSVLCSQCGKTSLYIQPCEYCQQEEFSFLAEDSQKEIIEEPLSIYNNHWFHVTHRKDWLKGVINVGLMVHIGHLKTVQDASKQLLFPQIPMYFWKLEISPTATIAPWVTVDLDNSWKKETKEFKNFIGFDGVRYLNLYEGTGLVSILLNPETIQPLSVEEFKDNNEFNEMYFSTAVS